MAEPGNEPRIYRGLKAVYFERSPTTFIDGKAGELRYRGYSIHDLAQHSCFEETAYLLIHGELPTAMQLASFDVALKSARTLPGGVMEVIRLVRDAHPMDVLRTAVSALAAFDPETADTSRDATIRKGVRLSSQVPISLPHMNVSAMAWNRSTLIPRSATPRTSSGCSRAASHRTMRRSCSTPILCCTPSTARTPRRSRRVW